MFVKFWYLSYYIDLKLIINKQGAPKVNPQPLPYQCNIKKYKKYFKIHRNIQKCEMSKIFLAPPFLAPPFLKP